jgi:hypothetical protein
METLVYTANILYLVSYLVRNILHLRLLTIVAACLLVTYFYNQAERLMTVVYWNLFFVALNAVQLFCILSERISEKSDGMDDMDASVESEVSAAPAM